MGNWRGVPIFSRPAERSPSWTRSLAAAASHVGGAGDPLFMHMLCLGLWWRGGRGVGRGLCLRLPVRSSARLCTHSTNSLINCSLTHSLIHSPTYSLTHLLTHLQIHPLTHFSHLYGYVAVLYIVCIHVIVPTFCCPLLNCPSLVQKSTLNVTGFCTRLLYQVSGLPSLSLSLSFMFPLSGVHY